MARKTKAEIAREIVKAKMTIRYFCPVLNQWKQKTLSESSFRSWEAECDLCGSHGGISVDFQCSCGKSHEFEIKGW